MPAYRAFISYNHGDEEIARRLHRRIESYRPPKRMTGADGVAPRRIAPVFRDRDELATSADLPGRIREALAGAENLVVLCSPRAVASLWVNREIEEFAATHGAERIHPVVVEGRAPEVFPPALLAVAREPLAADLTDGGDGFDDGALKLVAGLLPAPFAEVKNRERARERARARRNGALALLFAALAGLAVFFGWQATRELRRAEAAIVAAVNGIEGIATEVADGADRGDVSVAPAAELLATAQTMARDVVALAPENQRLTREYTALLLTLSRHYQRAGDLTRASDAASRAEALIGPHAARGDKRDLRLRALALDEQGEAAFARGDLEKTLVAYRESLEISRALAAREPERVWLGKGIAVSLHRIGDVHAAGGDLRLAMAAYEEALSVNRDLAAREPANEEWATSVAVSLNKIGDTRRLEGDLTGALAAYDEGLSIARRLRASDPENAGLVRDLAVSLGRIGNVLADGGDLRGALSAHQEVLGLVRDLASTLR